MRLHPEWAAILRYAWSIRLNLLAGALTAVDVALQIIVGIGTPTIALGIAAGVASGAALVARVVAQKDVP
jgi:hypothetical protein